MPSGSADRIDTLRRKIAGLHALSSNRSATAAESASARQTAQRLERELAQLLDKAPGPFDGEPSEPSEPESYRAAPPSSARWPEATAPAGGSWARGQRPLSAHLEPASNGWLSKVFYTIPPLIALAGFQVYRVQHDQERELSAAAQPAPQPRVQQAVERPSAEYCVRAERELKDSFVSSPRRWSQQLTFLSFAPRGCSGSFIVQLELAPRERHTSGDWLGAARSQIEHKLCSEVLTRSALMEHGGVFSFRVHDRMAQLLAEFQIDGGNCEASPGAARAHEQSSPRP